VDLDPSNLAEGDTLGASKGKFKATIQQPDGAIRWKLFQTEHAAEAWLNTKNRFVPDGSVTTVEKVK
jgi:hypothetical protein